MKSIIRNITKKAAALFTAALCLTACEDAGNDIYLQGHESSDLTVTESKVVLTKETAAQIVLSLAWLKSDLTVSDPSMSAPDLETIYVQVSTKEDFSGSLTENKETGSSRAYTGLELNTIAKNLGLEPDVSTPIYFRIRSSVGQNMESKYSSVSKVEVTPYILDMTVGFILESDKSQTPYTLLSPEANGIYTGFLGATSWYNFYLQEGDDVVWGNDPITGTPFQLGSSNDEEYPWNAWFPAPGGCYYVVVNTNNREWSGLYISTLNVSGDLQTEMTFDRRQLQWKAVFNFTAAGTKTIRLSGTGHQYNKSTGVDDAAAIETAIAFGGSANNLTFGNKAEDITVTVPGAGEYTLTIDLTNPASWTATIGAGSEEPEPVYPFLYLPGIDDGITGDWTFDNKLPLYDEDKKNYAGVINVNSLWGYQIAIEDGNWGDYYGSAEGDAYNGTLGFQADDMPAPDAGLYLIEASLTDLTYNLTTIGEQIWIMGMDDNYTFDTPLNATATPGIYSGEITIVEDTPWGLEIQLDDSWNYKFGGADGTLYFKGSAIDEPIVHTPGTYTVTVDLIQLTYSIQQ